LIAETLKALHQLPFHFLWIRLTKVLHSFLVIRLACRHHVIIDDQDAVSDGYRCSFSPSPFAQASLLFSQIGLGTSSGMGCLNKRCLHIHISWTCPSTLTLARTLLVTRADACP
jgi:hypothetical protein